MECTEVCAYLTFGKIFMHVSITHLPGTDLNKISYNKTGASQKFLKLFSFKETAAQFLIAVLGPSVAISVLIISHLIDL